MENINNIKSNTDISNTTDTSNTNPTNDNIVIAVMDRNEWTANTDIIVIVIPSQKKLVWIPRDLYSETINNRINKAFCKGRTDLLLKCVNAIGFNFNIEHCICLWPTSIEKFINKIGSIEVPVKTTRELKYPLHRHKPIEEGFKVITFNEPSEILTGDRFHEWIGARYAVKPKGLIGCDLDRIIRQQILIKELLNKNVDLNIIDGEIIKNIEDIKDIRGLNVETIQILKSIDSSWSISTIKHLDNKRINNKSVLIIKKLVGFN
jgi:anionic cell wall polymer biosynthesis LytR-Cps2A-Psr (LCP) family protein